MKTLSILFIAVFMTILTKAQTNKSPVVNATINLKNAGQKMCQLFNDKNYVAYIKYIHPTIIKMMGSESQMVELIKKSMQQTQVQGLTFEKATIGEPSKIITTNNELQAVIPEYIKMKAEKGHYTSTSYLLALSNDKGKTWYFFDTGSKTLAQMKPFFPNLSNQLVVPAKTQPVFSNN